MGNHRRHHGERRSTGEWAIRGGLTLVALVLGYVSITHSFADVVKRSDLDRAHALAPGDGRITALLAERRFAEQPVPGAQVSIARLAVLALRQDPTAVSAVATLGFEAQLRGDLASARKLFAYSQMLSRRHLPTQLWAIEDAVTHGDIPATLDNYDVALRTSKAAPDILFPVLATAIADPLVRTGLVATMRRHPAWASPFIVYAATSRNDPRATASLFAGLQRAGVPVGADATARVIDRLVETGASAVAWRYYARVHPGVDPGRSRDPAFTADPTSPSQFDWNPVIDGTVSASIQRTSNGGIVDFSVPAGAGGTLLRQMQILPPGTYRLAGRSAGIQQPAGSSPYWTVTCDGGREIGRVVVTNYREGGGAFAGRVQVPSGCPTQMLSLIAPASNEVGDSTGQIVRVAITPM